MIFEALELLRSELDTYVKPFLGNTSVVQFGSPATTSEPGKILIGLVNTEEEHALKNGSPYQRNAMGGFDLVNPPVFLNLYVLVCATYSTSETYTTALKSLGRAVQCFQQKNVFSLANSPNATGLLDPQAVGLRVSVELCSLSFERMNQLWGTLGGKQVPFVLYKVRVVEEQAQEPVGSGSAIMTIEGNIGGRIVEN